MIQPKKQFLETLTKLNYLEMTNHDLLWDMMAKTFHENIPKPKYDTKYRGYVDCKTTLAIVNAGIKDGWVRTIPNPEAKSSKEDENVLVAIEDVDFYRHIATMFSKAKSKEIIKEVEIMGLKKYEVVSFKSQGKSLAKHKSKIMADFVDDYLKTFYNVDLQSVLK